MAHWRARFGLLAGLALLAACAAPASIAAPPPPLTEASPPLRWRAVLAAGDPSLPVWDNAARALGQRLTASGTVVPGQLTRLSARREEAASGAVVGGRDAVLAAIRGMRPTHGEGCLVFLTMHGAPNAGLVFMPRRDFLSPQELDEALMEGCGLAPTLVVASGCFSGIFARAPMARPNRVVMTAARPDRSSFGCGAGFELTVFDDCFLQGIQSGGPVPASWEAISGCVVREERRQQVSPPSGPMLFVGPGMRALMLPPLPRA